MAQNNFICWLCLAFIYCCKLTLHHGSCNLSLLDDFTLQYRDILIRRRLPLRTLRVTRSLVSLLIASPTSPRQDDYPRANQRFRRKIRKSTRWTKKARAMCNEQLTSQRLPTDKKTFLHSVAPGLSRCETANRPRGGWSRCRKASATLPDTMKE